MPTPRQRFVDDDLSKARESQEAGFPAPGRFCLLGAGTARAGLSAARRWAATRSAASWIWVTASETTFLPPITLRASARNRACNAVVVHLSRIGRLARCGAVHIPNEGILDKGRLARESSTAASGEEAMMVQVDIGIAGKLSRPHRSSAR